MRHDPTPPGASWSPVPEPLGGGASPLASTDEATFTTDSINEDAVAAYVYAIING